MMPEEMPFEKPIIELRNKIAELKSFTNEKDIDLSGEITKLERRLVQLEEDIYGNMAPWDRVQLARHTQRPTTLDYIKGLFTDFMEFRGDRLYGDDEAIVGGVAAFDNQPVTVIGHQRGKDTKENIRRNFGMPHPEGYRKALRLMKQAEKFGRPIICFIDTKGAFPGKEAEERGQSEAIARNLLEMSGFKVPVVSIVIGEGGSGGALALGVADRIYMLENATYSVISPEGAATILWKDAAHAQEAAETMKITAPDLKELGIIDDVIPEIRGGAHRNLEAQTSYIRNTLKQAIYDLNKESPEELVHKRFIKFNAIGDYGYVNDANPGGEET
ncbi:acetyl-CoA carboxylase carboxyl transferase subunit alpha [Salisediminibacterium halotolerans]|uniref:Acetyl-coenzyme A carboxylase carboxyl transferase subunit alpha n=2 Tax=Salisediminibacterium halotolerans TaxID=517425 RepID=A0A1H9V5C7_9BACI|nr:acetyl-CoA carboxylase carboxyl transferase subunit alpha [Actinophytocola xinjiangensis]RPE84022.1 acetyl-CoA carboxylase carboxyl transferase subunit alpha [Salisediminibacterium halotolerans]TWG32427.1 acetyl-CoA carboxylase carboxyl transferase subunit alpha [Salisediminibacterium halotolerans]SES16882.1 acetyl-CoA carboxylase carboxyl transferase subunit alpha [Salisediminibacterium haloalkalitolerans]